MDLKENAKVGIVAGSKSDQETVDKITAVLDSFGIVWEFNILYREVCSRSRRARPPGPHRCCWPRCSPPGRARRAHDSSGDWSALRRRPAQRRRCIALHRADAPGNPGGNGRHRQRQERRLPRRPHRRHRRSGCPRKARRLPQRPRGYRRLGLLFLSRIKNRAPVRFPRAFFYILSLS